jgi:hypothetical protein
MHVRLKLRHVLQSSKTQYRAPAHADGDPFGGITAAGPPGKTKPTVQICLSTAQRVQETWRKTYLLTNDGMLKILCLDVEEHLKLICSNCQNKESRTSKGETHVRDAA